MTNLMNNAHKAHTEASRANHEETFGHKCHWHGCRNAVVKKDGLWLCQSCCEEGNNPRQNQSGEVGVLRETEDYEALTRSLLNGKPAVIFLDGSWRWVRAASVALPQRAEFAVFTVEYVDEQVR